jgi:hypothetical protein
VALTIRQVIATDRAPVEAQVETAEFGTGTRRLGRRNEASIHVHLRLLLGFGLEQLSTDAERSDLLDRALSGLLE